jgi:hypothetical protein
METSFATPSRWHWNWSEWTSTDALSKGAELPLTAAVGARNTPAQTWKYPV